MGLLRDIKVMEKLTEVRAAIVKACPDIVIDCIAHEQGEQEPAIEEVHRPIRLADVLRAMDKADIPYTLSVDQSGYFWKLANHEYWATGVEWNLAVDNLDDQSSETIAFLHSILCN